MLGNLMGRKFSVKCKHSIKHIKARTFERRKKKQAVLNFLKKDIADLLAIDEENNAFGRIDALITEVNHIVCYDMIEKFCEHILSRLPALQKRKESPEEATMEAMSTLIYAAARFSDLPELCDLRVVFTTRYGSGLQSSLSKEFVEKASRKSFSREQKLKMMQEIANEFSINWNPKDFGRKRTPPTIVEKPNVGLEECKPKQENSMDEPKIMEKDNNTKATNCVLKQSDPSPAANLMRKEPHPMENEAHLIPSPDMVKKELAPKQERKEPFKVRTFPDLKPKNTEIKVNVVPPYIKENGLRNALPMGRIQPSNPVEKKKKLVVDHAKHNAATSTINRTPPPYMKPSSTKVDVLQGADKGGEGMNRDVKPVAISVRKNRHGSAASNHKASAEDVAMDADERIDQIVYGRRHGDRGGTRSFDADYNKEDMEIDRLLMHYSSKGMASQSRKTRKNHSTIEEDKPESERVIARFASLPPETRTPRDGSNVDGRGGAQIHPRLPDYEEVAAQFKAMKRS